MFDQFPKTRTVLPASYQEIFQRHYLENREGKTRTSSVSRWMESWMHRQVAEDVHPGNAQASSTLEIGAGTLNHLAYEKGTAPYDVVEPFRELVAAFPQRKEQVRSFYKDIFEIDPGLKYKRIISIATFEHLTDLPMVVARAGLLLESQGVLRVAIPNEGTVLWKMGYSLTNGIEFRLRYKLDYRKIMEHEHVNTAAQIEEVLKHFFTSIHCRVMGVSRPIGFYRFYACRSPRLDQCLAFLKERKYPC